MSRAASLSAARRSLRRRLAATPVLLLELLVLAGLLGLWQQWAHAHGRVTLVEEVVVVAATPFQGVVNGVGGLARTVWNAFPAARIRRLQNRELQNEVARLREENNALREEMRRAGRAQALSAIARESPYATLSAQVVARNDGGWMAYLVIDRGRTDGVADGQAVIATDGLVGQTYAVAAHSSRVLPIIDRASSVAARVQESRLSGIVKGTGASCRFRLLSDDPPPRRGVVISSGLGGIYPPGLLIGSVTGAESDPATATQWLDVAPSVDFNRLEEVLVLTGRKP